MSPSALFTPIKIGDVTLKHRVVLAPLTRSRANTHGVHGDLGVTYYSQRSSTPGTLLISEATLITDYAGAYPSVPGLWSDEQLAGWKKVTDAVHANGSYIYAQLWAWGRQADPDVMAKKGHPYVSASDVQLTGKRIPPRPLTVAEIKEYVHAYATAASNAVHRAGFDGVEVHGANGYLIDQFLQDVSNKRTDEYGGSIENRCRFALEILDAVVKAVGETKTGIRMSPWGAVGDMRMKDPIPTFRYYVQCIAQRFPSLAYIHVIEPRVNGYRDRSVLEGESNDFIREIWAPRPLISAGGYTRELAFKVAENKGDMIAFGRPFIANPDLPVRLQKNIPLLKGDRKTYYTVESPVGYIDYPFAHSSEPEETLRAVL